MVVQGNIASYFVDKYGFDPQCSVVAATGDNPCLFWFYSSFCRFLSFSVVFVVWFFFVLSVVLFVVILVVC